VTGGKECVATANHIRAGVVATVYPESRLGRLQKEDKESVSALREKKIQKKH
jgi:hypothetical protein